MNDSYRTVDEKELGSLRGKSCTYLKHRNLFSRTNLLDYQATPEDSLSLNKLIRALNLSPMRGLLFPKLDMDSVSIRVYTDTGRNTYPDMTSQLGVIALLVDKELRCNSLHWSSSKCQR